MLKITIAMMLLLASAFAQTTELRAENESNGSMIISSDPCPDATISELFEYKAWATENGKIIFNGCWMVVKYKEQNFIVIHWADDLVIKYPPSIFKE